MPRVKKIALKIASWNLCNGLANKIQYVTDLLHTESVDVLFLQETEIASDYDENLLSIKDYRIEIANTLGTKRVAAYIHNNISYKRNRETEGTNVLLLNLDVKYTITQLVGVYRQFKQTANQSQLFSFKKQLSEITDFLKDEDAVMITGDFNLDFNKINTQNYTCRRIYDELLELTYAFDLEQMVKEDTWSRMYQGTIRSSILDHVYLSNNEIMNTISVEKQPISDHSVVVLTTVGDIKTASNQTYEYDCWKHYTKEALKSELRNNNFDILCNLNVQEIADKLDQILGTIKDKLVPRKRVTKSKTQVTLPAHIIEMKHKLKNLYKSAKKQEYGQDEKIKAT